MACLRDSGILEPPGMTTALGSRTGLTASDGAVVAALCAELWALGLFVGFGESTACPQAIPEIRSKVASARIQHLQGGHDEFEITTALRARMHRSTFGVIRRRRAGWTKRRTYQDSR